MLQQIEARRTPRDELIAAGNKAGDRKSDRHRKASPDLFRRHDVPVPIAPHRSFAGPGAGRHHILN
jgi:hypothetical protein